MLSNDKDILRQRHEDIVRSLKDLQDQNNTQKDKLKSYGDTLTTLESDIKTSHTKIRELDESILLQEQDICHYSQANLKVEHHNSNLVKARLKHEEFLSAEDIKLKEQQAELEKKKKELRHVKENGKRTSIECTNMNLKLKQVKANKQRGEETLQEKKHLLAKIETGVANALGYIDDPRSLKNTMLQLSEQLLCDKRKRNSDLDCNGESVLILMDKKIGTITMAIEHKKKIHANEIARLDSQYDSLSKVSSYYESILYRRYRNLSIQITLFFIITHRNSRRLINMKSHQSPMTNYNCAGEPLSNGNSIDNN